MHGFVAILAGGLLFAIAALVAIIQVVAVRRRQELLRFFPPALGATVVGLLSGVFLVAGAEYRWVSPELLDDLALPVMIASLWWIFHNRMGSKRNRAAPHG